MIEPFPGIGFDGLLVDRADAILGSDQVEVAVDHPYFGLLGRDLASQVPRHLQVAIDGLADRYPLVSDRRVHPFVERDVHLLDRSLHTQEIALRFWAGCRYADGKPDAIDHVAQEQELAGIDLRIEGERPQIHRAQPENDGDDSANQRLLELDICSVSDRQGDDESAEHPGNPVDQEGVVLEIQGNGDDTSYQEREIAEQAADDRLGDDQQGAFP